MDNIKITIKRVFDGEVIMEEGQMYNHELINDEEQVKRFIETSTQRFIERLRQNNNQNDNTSSKGDTI
jgi:hypothetical protein